MFGDCYYRKEGNRVFLTGLTRNRSYTAEKQIIGILPEGYRPKTQKIFNMTIGDIKNNQIMGRVDIRPNGELFFDRNGSHSERKDIAFLSFDSINFPIDK